MEQAEKLEALNKELNAIINASYDGIFVTDGAGFVRRINKAYERISKLRQEDIIGLHMSEMIQKGMINQSVTLMVLQKKDTISIMQDIQGTQVMATGSPIWDGGGIAGVITNIRDLTELNSLREQLQSSVSLARRYEEELAYLRSRQSFDDGIIAVSPLSKQLLDKCHRLANVDSAVLITGETGAGKDMIAKFIHNSSLRAKQPFMMINCTTLSENLLESELFGYERGAFTGANKEGKRGLIELAGKGTFLLDEIGDLSMSMQAKLLRLLQDKEYIKVGGNAVKKTHARFLAATNKNLQALVKSGLFREDLYYRLSVVPLHVPPLRERSGDILPLINFFLANFNKKYGRNNQIDDKTLDLLKKYHWPGNVRELEHTIEQLAVLSIGEKITVADLPPNIKGPASRKAAAGQSSRPLDDTMAAIEKDILSDVLKETGNIYSAARQLNIHRTTLIRKMKKYGLEITKEAV